MSDIQDLYKHLDSELDMWNAWILKIVDDAIRPWFSLKRYYAEAFNNPDINWESLGEKEFAKKALSAECNISIMDWLDLEKRRIIQDYDDNNKKLVYKNNHHDTNSARIKIYSNDVKPMRTNKMLTMAYVFQMLDYSETRLDRIRDIVDFVEEFEKHMRKEYGHQLILV